MLMLEKSKDSSVDEKNISDTSQAILAFVSDAEKSPEFKKLSKEQKSFLLGGMYFRLDAISDQLTFGGDAQVGYETKALTQMFGDLAGKLVKERK